jgi:hypothetical protein
MITEEDMREVDPSCADTYKRGVRMTVSRHGCEGIRPLSAFFFGIHYRAPRGTEPHVALLICTMVCGVNCNSMYSICSLCVPP